MKLVQREAESLALRRYLREHGDDPRVTSALARTEVVRAILPGGPDAIRTARQQLDRVHQVPVDQQLLDRAGTLAPDGLLRSLDAIHLASAQLLGADLVAVVTYDRRMATVAEALGLPVAAPA